ncbi:metal-dependent phosphohydrolase [Salipaludibacillus neizhouensis]|uniref:Metal-dependent phosphohydrolase n=1 Tax=Salipaludibacillus neizhouensis TaxID=885475 RepID=A0A3A9K8L1_9BACI|nr:HD domain-containing phosphohydrolase [Salipaludibacillus neizhouensis]RKL68847.1 metal-dependent phosphohydrolase [Salipaludibacillus neizhouensis]
MRYASINKIEQGEKLGKHIFADDGRILLSEGVTLTIGLLSKLRLMGVSSVFVQDDRFENIEIEEVVSETTKRQAITALAETIQFIQADKEINGKEISLIVGKMIDEVMLNSDVLLHLTDIRTKDNNLFVHLVNVCIISVMVGVQIGLAKTRIQDLAVGALLHDIGKTQGRVKKRDIPVGYSSEDELMKHHSWKGFNTLRKVQEISTVSAHIALTHHENVDGSGEPRGMEGKDINFLSKIVAVANDYDHLISNGEDGMSLFPHEACERIMGLTNIRYDHQVVWKFLRCVAFYPTGIQVKLNDGSIGVVIGQHKGLPQRPIVRTYRSDGDDFSFKEVDLAKETTTFITKVFT